MNGGSFQRLGKSSGEPNGTDIPLPERLKAAGIEVKDRRVLAGIEACGTELGERLLIAHVPGRVDITPAESRLSGDLPHPAMRHCSRGGVVWNHVARAIRDAI